MDYASLLVHVPKDAHRQTLLDTAFELSATFDAHLTALHVYVPSYHDYVAPGTYPYAPRADSVQQENEAAEQRDAKLETDFEQRASRAGLTQIQ